MLCLPSWTMPAAAQGRLIGRVLLGYATFGVVLALLLIHRRPPHTTELGIPGRAPASAFLISMAIGSLLAGRWLSRLYWQRVSRLLLSAHEMQITPSREYGATGRALLTLFVVIGLGMAACVQAHAVTDLVLAALAIAGAAMINLLVSADLQAWERRHHVSCYCLRDGSGSWILVKAQRRM